MPTIDLSGHSFDAMIFDCDGTLVDSAPLHYNAFKIALSQQDAVLDREWYSARLGLSRLALLTEFNEQCSLNIDLARAVAESETQYLFQTRDLKEIPEVASIARQYYGKVPLAVASSGQKHSVHESLKGVGLLHLFDYLITANDVLACKPDPAIYHAAANKLQTNITQCLVFEDTNEGIMSASTAGAHVVDVRSFASIYSETPM